MFFFFQYVRSSYRVDRIKFESKISNLENSLAKEKELREEGEVKVWKLTQDLEKSKDEVENVAFKYHDTLINIESKVTKLKEENEKLKTDNFELVIENVSIVKYYIYQESLGA